MRLAQLGCGSICCPPAHNHRCAILFRGYVDARLEAYRKLPDIDAALLELGRANQFQREIWSQAVVAGRLAEASPAATMLLLPALNQMIDITTTRTMSAKIHPPIIIFVMLFAVSLASALLAGYGMSDGRSRNWLHILVFGGVLTMAVYVTLDIEFPRLGLIRVDDFDQVLIELREDMK